MSHLHFGLFSEHREVGRLRRLGGSVVKETALPVVTDSESQQHSESVTVEPAVPQCHSQSSYLGGGANISKEEY